MAGVPAGWTITAIADFNGDGRADVLWQHVDGLVVVWLTSSDGMSVTASVVTFNGAPVSLGSNSSWRLLATGKFGGGAAGVVWQDTSTGDVALWHLDGTSITSGAWVARSLPPAWQFRGLADFNGDGTDDLLWQESGTGRVVMWIMNGDTPASVSALGTLGPDWTYRGAAAFDGGAKAQMLWQHTTSGLLGIWLMDGVTISGTANLGVLDSSWAFKGLGRFNADATADILWQNTNGEVVTWLINAQSVSGAVSSGIIPPDWLIR